ncbi:MAG: DbpA RNA binding domain-containing protein [Treponema sp.]|jgi:hypothetical protein|nr:DbpA RNA binding domain-containing protein [Treponema sp.]
MPRLDNEKAKRTLRVILDKLHSDTDISLLNEYRKLFKKEVSFFRRSWAGAWLLMYYDQKETPRFRSAERPTRSGGDKTPASEETPLAAAETTLPEEESKRLFISVGKNRRLYPRDIINLLMSKTGVPREDIGAIRILDNYSFIQVRDTMADEIIDTLNGIRFRGRAMTVNYAKSKSEEPAAKNEE